MRFNIAKRQSPDYQILQKAKRRAFRPSLFENYFVIFITFLCF
nr:MAG TPA: hypothetical protein [Caudoviricetes sp.]